MLGLHLHSFVPLAAGGFAPRPQLPAAQGITSRPPIVFGGWELYPQTPKIAPPHLVKRISGYALGFKLRLVTIKRPQFGHQLTPVLTLPLDSAPSC